MTRREKRKRKRFINYFIIGATFSFMFIIGIEEYKDSKIKEKRLSNIQYTAQDTSMRYQQEEQNKEEVKIYPKEEILKEYKGYKVAAKIEIPKIKLETYIAALQDIMLKIKTCFII